MNDREFQASVARSENLSESSRRTRTWKKPKSISDSKARFPGFHQRKTHYKTGQVVKAGYKALSIDVIMHESVPMKLSDGTTLYCDIFLPARFEDLDGTHGDKQRVPAVVAWSPYGKQGGTQILSDYPFHCGVPPSSVSSLQKWEGPDPAFWCSYDYAIVNVDTRGTFTSEGDAHLLGHQEAKDGAEFVTWLSRQKWCNGKVGLSGNSYLAAAQWYIASLRPEGLAGIAPWEGLMDMYKDVVCAGGIPDTAGIDIITSAFAGQGRLEDIVAAANGDGSGSGYDKYWQDKRAVVERINVPVYTVASWTSIFHTNGTLKAWRLVPDSVPKWLRVHNIQEWPDYYEHRNTMDLKRFFDWCLKGQQTDWKSTPKVRLSILNFGMTLQEDTIERAEHDFPLARTKYTKYYLQPDKTLSLTPPFSHSELSYNTNRNNSLIFEYTLPHPIETTGYPHAHLIMSTTSTHNEIDIFVQIEKFSPSHYRQGTLVLRPKFGPQYALLKFIHDWQIGMSKLGLLYHWGSDGRLRASYALDKDEASTEYEPSYSFTERAMLKAGEKRVLDVPMRAYGMYWEKGDILRFTVSGRPVVPLGLPGAKGPATENEGVHFVGVGGRGEESSCLVLPVV
ncbi:hypothetical protein LTR05_003469 [Lithohypha guttulata]|uniref:Xaa-Pro dipeptidyl-peptidase C-terminal domain-containing protein n=1 Tax=Lithohypha guttulata TaxID=1690604 RepID=A0AAN7SZZ9_9EURO|nr:hypothetical protein LTR05_003469 [Lithohypha guttulata]